ncbi:MAG: cupin domain-containing protein [Fimbriimonadaceae bacterium]|nr:cupin domain-containing protein [Fimbriimonadaceae bacterium]
MAGCHVIRNSDTYEGKQGLTYFTGICRENVGAQGVCLHMLTVPGGGRANAHYHDGHESAIYMMSGHAVQMWGDALEHIDEVFPGDYVYIPAGVPHVVMNASMTEPMSAIIARTDPSEQESVILAPELESIVSEFIARRFGGSVNS